MRDHQMTGADGRLLALSTTAYVLVSTRSRRIQLPGALDIAVPDNHGKYALDETLEKILPAEGLEECFTLQAGYSMVDIMGHVNNARYIDWISDCFAIEDYQAHRPEWLQINYLNEVKAGESVTLLRAERPGIPGAWYLTGMNKHSGSKAFEAELHWV